MKVIDLIKKITLTLLACFLVGCSTVPTWNYPVTKINGETPLGEIQSLVNTKILIDTLQTNGDRLLVTMGTRQAGTRVGIHVHEYGGHTCVLTGDITVFVEGKSNEHYPAGTCYYMPPNTPMSASNLGKEDAVLTDTFILPVGAPPATMLEQVPN